MGQTVKFDMSRAWNQATAMLGGNRDLVAVVAGIFFFLPGAVLSLMTPDTWATMPQPRTEAEMQAFFDAVLAVYAQIWPYLLMFLVLQALGSLALLALLRDSSRPTLGEALKLGVVGFLPYIATQLIIGFGFSLIGGIIAGGAAAASPALGALAIFILLAGLIYVMVRTALVMPVIGIERIYNPFGALRRSWRLTGGNSLRLFAFFVLIMVAGWVVTTVLAMILGLAFALFGAEGAKMGGALVGSVLNATLATVFLAALAAAHRQLADTAG